MSKGSPERILGMCRNQMIDGDVGPLQTGAIHDMVNADGRRGFEGARPWLTSTCPGTRLL